MQKFSIKEKCTKGFPLLLLFTNDIYISQEIFYVIKCKDLRLYGKNFVNNLNFVKNKIYY